MPDTQQLRCFVGMTGAGWHRRCHPSDTQSSYCHPSDVLAISTLSPLRRALARRTRGPKNMAWVFDFGLSMTGAGGLEKQFEAWRDGTVNILCIKLKTNRILEKNIAECFI